jgi:mono/diheme cytochrome c family protein
MVRRKAMKRHSLSGSIFIVTALILVAFLTSIQMAEARAPDQSGNQLPRGGALYDNWFLVLGKPAPQGNMPLWTRQTTNTISGADTWRCVTCHGWDYQGKDGAYRSGSHYTGFPNILFQVQDMSQEEIVAHLKGSKDPSHNFSSYIDDTNLNDLAYFLKNGLINDNDFIDPVSLKVKGGDAAHGNLLYDQQCNSCHGSDGTKIKFRFEGLNATMGTLATRDPWRFLHKSRFGTPGTPMVIGFDLKWTPQDGRDVLLYSQSLPVGEENQESPPSLGERIITPRAPLGGPPSNFFGGILIALAAIGTGIGFAVLLGAGAVGVILLAIWFIRGRK